MWLVAEGAHCVAIVAEGRGHVGRCCGAVCRTRSEAGQSPHPPPAPGHAAASGEVRQLRRQRRRVRRPEETRLCRQKAAVRINYVGGMNNNKNCIDGRICLNLSKTSERAAELNFCEACCQWALL